MKNNKLIISAAGSGKTTFLVNQALAQPKTERVLITTYTEANEVEIRKKILETRKYVPSNITIQTWFSFLLQHGVRPYQGSLDDILWETDIKGMFMDEGQSGKKFDKDGNHLKIGGYPQYWGEDNFEKHYFTNNWRIYSDKISKFIIKCNGETGGAIISRISKVFSKIYIDEVQDLAGFDLELIKLLFKSTSEVLLVGDPRQVTYLTHPSKKHKKNYGNGRIKEFLNDHCKSLLEDDSIDETTLKKSHRNNAVICEYSSRLYPDYEESEACTCDECRNEDVDHEGIYVVRSKDLKAYLDEFKPVQLRWNKSKDVDKDYAVYNFGESKGQTHDRVVIYPTDKMIQWILKNDTALSDGVRAKLYVALTRARHSAAIIYDYSDDEHIPNVTKI